MDCYFSTGDVKAKIPNRAEGWTHAIYTYENGNAIIYINGQKQGISTAKDAIALEFDQPIVWKDSLVNEFRLDEAKRKVASGVVSGNIVIIKLKGPTQASKITYLDEMNWSQNNILIGKNRIATLTFCNVPVLDKRKTK